MSEKTKDRTGEKAKTETNKAGVVTRGAWAKMQEESGPDLDPLKEDDGMGRGLQMSCVSEMIQDVSYPQGESQAHDISPEAVEDETDGGESSSDRKSLSAKDRLKLNIDVVLHLFKFMKPGDILKASQTCWFWREWGENEKVWELKCKETGLAYTLTSDDLKALERRNEKPAVAYSAWKVNFLKPYHIAKNFREGDPQMLTIEIRYNENNNDVSHLEFNNDKIVTVSGRPPRYIHIFCAQSGNLLHELVGHTMQVGAIQMDQEFVVTSSLDGSMKVWSVETGACIHTIDDDHTRGILSLKMHGPILVSGSKDGTLRIWNVREGSHLRTLTGHTGWVGYVQFDGNFVVSGAVNTIKIWDAVTGDCVHTLSLNVRINSLKFNGVHVVARSFRDSVGVWDVETGVRRHTLEGNNNFWYRQIEMEGNMVVCSGVHDLTTAEIWDISTGVRLHRLAGPHKHNDPIHGIQISEKFVLTSTKDETAKFWDIKTGEFIRDLVLGLGLREEKTIDRQQFREEYPTLIRMKNAKIVGAVRSSTRSQILVLNFDPNDDEN